MKTRKLKTPQMRLIEALDPQKRAIEQIMSDLYREHGSQTAAAAQMGITKAAYSQWVYRLEIELPELNGKANVGLAQPQKG